MNTEFDLVHKFAPLISFSRHERYFPCPIFLSGDDIINNRTVYDRLPYDRRNELISCYYHVVDGETVTAYQYWYYYAYNDYSGGWTGYLPDRHDHDIEFAIVYVDKSTWNPVAMALNQHHWLNWIPNPNLEMPVFAEEGGHGMFRHKRSPDKWKEGGIMIKVDPRETAESLRERFVSPEPSQLIEEDGTLRGQIANFIGMWAKPKVPWARFREYALPISKLLSGAQEEIRRLMSRTAVPYTYYTVPEFTLSIPYDRPTRQENLDEALRLGLITRDQYETLSASS